MRKEIKIAGIAAIGVTGLVVGVAAEKLMSQREIDQAALNYLNSRTPQTTTPLSRNPKDSKVLSLTSTPTQTEVPLGFAVIPQELNMNTYRENAQTESHVWKKVIDGLKKDYQDKDKLKASNSLLTTLANPPLSQNPIVFGVYKSDPKTEPGLWQTPEDWDNFKDLYGLTPDTKVLSLFRTNQNAVDTAGIFGRADDRDAIAYYVASLIVAHKHPKEFENTTIDDLNKGNLPPQFKGEILDTEDSIFVRIQLGFLKNSDEETQRRAKNSDASSKIPKDAQRPDQYKSCDVFRPKRGKREDQQQSVRVVTHTDGGNNTFEGSNVGAEGSLITISIDPKTGNWGVRSITNRNYPTNLYDKNAVSSSDAAGEQEINCGTGKPPATAIPQGEGPSQGQPEKPQPTQPGKITEVPAPTNSDVLRTPTQAPSFPTPSRTTPTPIPVGAVIGLGGAFVERKRFIRRISSRR